ncbi:MAG: hypothetical protein AB7O65_10550 [Candidatus Korobacteraceae bacterium]
MTYLHAATILVLICAFAACGGESSASSQTPQPGACNPVTTPTSPASTPSGILSGAMTVTVQSGTTATGIDIGVQPTASSPLNALFLGVGSVGSTITLRNTGDVIRRGQTRDIALVGNGVNTATEVTILGPPDIQIAGVTTAGSNGVRFTAVVSSDAALGMRTVLLRNSAGVTAFTGGLEVLP